MPVIDVHQCPRCELRFTTVSETEDHLFRDHDVILSPFAGDHDDQPVDANPAGTIVVPVDPVRPNSVAVDVAMDLASMAGYAIQLVASTPPGLDDRAVDATLEMRSRALRSDASPARHAVLGPGDPAARVNYHVHKTGSDLLCLASHGRTQAGEALFGSTSEGIIRNSPVPGIVCGPRCKSPTRPERLLVGFDGSDLSARAAGTAAVLAKTFGLSLELLEVIDPEVIVPSDIDETAGLRHLADALPVAVERFGTLHFDRPADALVDESDRRPGSLIVVGTHGRTGARRLLLGSVAHTVVRRSTRPVVVVPPTMPE